MRTVTTIQESTSPAVDGKNGPSAPDNVPGPPTTKTLVPWTQEDALYELNVIPLFFPLSYSLVKPYVEGFEIDGNGSPDIKGVKINSGWNAKQDQPAS
jgi:hypothetical protein